MAPLIAGFEAVPRHIQRAAISTDNLCRLQSVSLQDFNPQLWQLGMVHGKYLASGWVVIFPVFVTARVVVALIYLQDAVSPVTSWAEVETGGFFLGLLGGGHDFKMREYSKEVRTLGLPHRFEPNGNGVFVCLFVCLSHEARPPHAYRTTLTKQKHNVNNTNKQMNTSNTL